MNQMNLFDYQYEDLSAQPNKSPSLNPQYPPYDMNRMYPNFPEQMDGNDFLKRRKFSLADMISVIKSDPKNELNLQGDHNQIGLNNYSQNINNFDQILYHQQSPSMMPQHFPIPQNFSLNQQIDHNNMQNFILNQPEVKQENNKILGGGGNAVDINGTQININLAAANLDQSESQQQQQPEKKKKQRKTKAEKIQEQLLLQQLQNAQQQSQSSQQGEEGCGNETVAPVPKKKKTKKQKEQEIVQNNNAQNLTNDKQEDFQSNNSTDVSQDKENKQKNANNNKENSTQNNNNTNNQTTQVQNSTKKEVEEGGELNGAINNGIKIENEDDNLNNKNDNDNNGGDNDNNDKFSQNDDPNDPNNNDQNSTSNKKNGNKRIYIKRTTEKVRRWTKEESLLYEKFIEMYLDIMRDSSSKRNKKIFLLMSKFIGTKTPSQCRSHHQKFFKKIIKALTKDPNAEPKPLIDMPDLAGVLEELEKGKKKRQNKKKNKENEDMLNGKMEEGQIKIEPHLEEQNLMNNIGPLSAFNINNQNFYGNYGQNYFQNQYGMNPGMGMLGQAGFEGFMGMPQGQFKIPPDQYQYPFGVPSQNAFQNQLQAQIESVQQAVRKRSYSFVNIKDHMGQEDADDFDWKVMQKHQDNINWQKMFQNYQVNNNNSIDDYLKNLMVAHMDYFPTPGQFQQQNHDTTHGM